jgi:hypothetical protein
MFRSKIFNPQELIDYLKSISDLKQCYQQKVRHYTIEHHTLLVINEFEKYFAQIELPLNKNLIRLMLALHDIGKPQAFIGGNIGNQYKYTTEKIDSLRNFLPFSSPEIDLCIILISLDPLGMFLQGHNNLKTAKNEIITLACKTNLTIPDFFKLITVYYQCDTASYTKDAGGLKYLEFLFVYKNGIKVFDDLNKRLKFSSNFETKFIELEKTLLS